MPHPVRGAHALAPRWAALLPPAYLAHLCEEWWGGPGFAAWAALTMGMDVSPSRFLAINAVALPLFAVTTVAALRSARFGWLAAALATLLFVNGCLHLLATAVFATYSPGVVTGALLYLPLGGLVCRSMSRSLSAAVFARAVAVGVAAHAVVVVAALA